MTPAAVTPMRRRALLVAVADDRTHDRRAAVDGLGEDAGCSSLMASTACAMGAGPDVTPAE